MEIEDRKTQTTIRLEPRLKRAARVRSLHYSGCRLSRVGSWAWYMRQALIEKLIRDGFDLRELSSDCAAIYEVYTSDNR